MGALPPPGSGEQSSPARLFEQTQNKGKIAKFYLRSTISPMAAVTHDLALRARSLRCAQKCSPKANNKFEQGAERLRTAHSSVRVARYSGRLTVKSIRNATNV